MPYTLSVRDVRIAAAVVVLLTCIQFVNYLASEAAVSELREAEAELQLSIESFSKTRLAHGTAALALLVTVLAPAALLAAAVTKRYSTVNKSRIN